MDKKLMFTLKKLCGILYDDLFWIKCCIGSGLAMKEILVSAVLFFLCAVAFIISIFSFLQKGFLLNNAFLYATKKERERLNKKPYYRQTAVVFLFIAAVFLLNGLSVLFALEWISYIAIAFIFAAVIYAVYSSAKIKRDQQ